MLDSKMTMSQHVSRVCQNCYFQIRLIRRLGKALSVKSKLLLVHALVHSWLDYCNSVLARLPWSLIQQLQSVLNSVARLILAWRLWSHYTCPDGFALASIPAAHYIQTVYDVQVLAWFCPCLSFDEIRWPFLNVVYFNVLLILMILYVISCSSLYSDFSI